MKFEASCLRRMELCGPGLTCSGGDCVNAELDSNAIDNSGTTSNASRMQDGGMPGTPAPSESGIAAAGEHCDVEGELRCAGFASAQPLRCESSTWQRQPECTAAQRCDTSKSADRGKCQPLARECTGQTCDLPFCDDEIMHVCNADLLGSAVVPCGENQHCTPDAKGRRRVRVHLGDGQRCRLAAKSRPTAAATTAAATR